MYINRMTDEEQIQTLSECSDPVNEFQKIKDPSEPVQVWFFNRFSNYFEHIKNPTTKVKLAAVKRRGKHIVLKSIEKHTFTYLVSRTISS